jgi:hypothetical protein
MSDKIKSHHLGRKAILYVRQSSAHQVMHNGLNGRHVAEHRVTKSHVKWAQLRASLTHRDAAWHMA